MTHCSRHAGQRAAWRCENCQRTLCPDCAARSGLANTTAVLCVHCGGLAQTLMAPRPRRPYWQMFPTFLKAIFSLEGGVQILALAIAMIIAGLIPLVGPLLSKFIFISYYFRVIMQSAHGAERLPEPSDFTDVSDLLGPVFRFFLASLLIWVPALLYVLMTVGLTDFNFKDVSGAVIFLLVAVGVIYFPAAIIVAAISDSALAVINPAITVRMILRFPSEYLLTVAVWGALNVLDGFIWINLMVWGNKLHIPIFVPILVNMIGLIVPIFTGFILGRLIYQNAQHFKLLGKKDMQDPEWPDAMPRGSRPTQAEAVAQRQAGPSGIDLPPPSDDLESAPLGVDGPPEASAPAPVTPLDLPDDELEFDPTSLGQPAAPSLDLPPPDQGSPAMDPAVAGDGPALDLPSLDLGDVPAAAAATLAAANTAGEGEQTGAKADADEGASPGAGEAPKHETMEEKLRRALREDNSVDALKAYKAIRSAGIHPALPVRLELRLAGFLEKVGQYEEAVIACQRAAKDEMKGPFAARAIFTAARLLSEKLGNPTRGVELYRHVADNFPQDELSMYAADAVRKLERS